MHITIKTDGGSRGNPGPAAAAVVIWDDSNREIFRRGYYLGKTTNNIAEYAGLLNALREARKLGATKLDIFCDSELIVKQVNGLYKVKNAALKQYYQQINSLKQHFPNVSIQHIFREQNKDADRLVNITLTRHAQGLPEPIWNINDDPALKTGYTQRKP